MNYWRVPRMWVGQTVAVLASGPSMSAAVAASVAHLPRIAVNSTYLLARDADVVYAGDLKWWQANPEALACRGIKCAIEPRPGVWPQAMPGSVVALRNTGRDGFDRDPGAARTYKNSGAVALQIAVKAGASRILLLGFDMRGGHWHPPHSIGNPTAEMLARCVIAFRGLAKAIAPLGPAVLNCSPGSALDCFPRVSLADALETSPEAA